MVFADELSFYVFYTVFMCWNSRDQAELYKQVIIIKYKESVMEAWNKTLWDIIL